jgi:hypothetical protein
MLPMKKLIGAARLIRLERRCWGGQVTLQPEMKQTLEYNG